MGNFTSIWDTQNQTSANDCVDSTAKSTPSNNTHDSCVISKSEPIRNAAKITSDPVTVSTDWKASPLNTVEKSTLVACPNPPWILLRNIPISKREHTSDPICINGTDFLIVSIEDDENYFNSSRKAFIHLYLYNSITDEWNKLQNYRNNESVQIEARGTKCVDHGGMATEVFTESTIESVSYIEKRRYLYILTWAHIIRFVLPRDLKSNRDHEQIRYYIERHEYNMRIRNPRCFVLKNTLHIISSEFEYYCISDSTTTHLKSGASAKEMHSFCAAIGFKAVVYCELIRCVLMFCCDKSMHCYSEGNDKWSKLEICSPFVFSKASFAVTYDKKYILIVRRYRFDNMVYIFDVESLEFRRSNVECQVDGMNDFDDVCIAVTEVPNTEDIVLGCVRKWSRECKKEIPNDVMRCICKYCEFNFVYLMMSGYEQINSWDDEERNYIHLKVCLSDVISKQSVICSNTSL